ncbi:MAG: hypothetical protein IJC19_08755, partial [Clostridia bacterium]|nr:hypothetical protein [Clostridia bacterium]
RKGVLSFFQRKKERTKEKTSLCAAEILSAEMFYTALAWLQGTAVSRTVTWLSETLKIQAVGVGFLAS